MDCTCIYRESFLALSVTQKHFPKSFSTIKRVPSRVRVTVFFLFLILHHFRQRHRKLSLLLVSQQAHSVA